MNKVCTQITTNEEGSKLLCMILAEDNEMGPMGSGGYKIRAHGPVEGIVHIQCNQMDCTPSPTNHMFMENGTIWVTYMKSWVMELLAENNISFSCKQVKNPDFIEQKMTELQAV